jgi:hypothetical protein
MTDKNKSNTSGQKSIFKDNGRGLPTTGTKTPMPQVKPPKQPESTKKS